MRAIKVLVPLIAVVAVAALAGAAIAITQKPKSYAPQIHRFEIGLASASAEIKRLRAGSQTGEVTALRSRINSLDSAITSFKICVPQLEQQINGESIGTDTQNGYLTDAYINNPAIISANCQKLLNG